MFSMALGYSVENHTTQRGISHSRDAVPRASAAPMDEGEIFRKNLIAAIEGSDWNEASLSVAAGLNRRAVTDIREGRVRNPRVSTVFALARALGQDPAEMLGLGSRVRVQTDLAKFLASYSEADQERFLAALRALGGLPDAGR